MTRNYLFTFGVLATLLFCVEAAAQEGGLTPVDVEDAMKNNERLKSKTYRMVDFHVLNDKGEVEYIETLGPTPAVAGGVNIFSVANQLGPAQRCKALAPTAYRIVTTATTIVHWCDPANNDMLQSDIFQISFNGAAGKYFVSFRFVSCTAEADDIPSNIHLALCAPPHP